MAVKEELSEWEIAPTRKMYSYGLGYLIINYFLYGGWALVWYFYEVEIGLSVLYLMLAVIIFAIWNMINDPLLGYLTEKPFKWTKKYGFRAPWIVISVIPFLIIYFFIWIPPMGVSAFTIFLYFIIATCLFDTFFSIFTDHLYGGFVNQFPSEYERRRAFAITTLLMFLGIACLSIIGNFLVVYGDPSSFVRYALVVVIILVVLTLILFTAIKESEEMKEMFIKSYEKTEKISFIDTTKAAFKIKNFNTSLFAYVCGITASTLWLASEIYMFKDVYKLPYAYGALPGIIGVLCVMATIPFWTNYARKHGFKKTYWMAYILHGLSFIPFLFITDYILICIFYAIMFVFYGGEIIMVQPVGSDTFDEVATKIGKRVDATMVGIRTFFYRVAFIIQAIVFATISILTGYNPDPKATQSPLAVWGIRVRAALIPMILLIVAGLVFRKYFTIEGAEKEALIMKLKEMGLYR